MANSALAIDRRRANLFKGTVKAYKGLAQQWLNNPDNWKKGRRTLAGFSQVHGYLNQDGVPHGLKVDSKTGALSTVNKDKQDISSKKAYKSRKAGIDVQTGENIEKFDWANKPEEMDAHHIRMVKMFTPFYENLDPYSKEAKELTQHAIDEGYALGDAKVNLENMTKPRHKRMHAWMMENNIQVRPGKPGESNILRYKDGTIRGAKGGSDLNPTAIGNAKMPYLGHLSINERRAAMSIYFKYVQDPVEEQIANIQRQEFSNQLDSSAPTVAAAQRTIDRSTPRPNKAEIKRHKGLGEVWSDDEWTFVPKDRPAPGVRENQAIQTAQNVAKTGLEVSLDLASGGGYTTYVKNPATLALQLKNQDYMGAAGTLLSSAQRGVTTTEKINANSNTRRLTGAYKTQVEEVAKDLKDGKKGYVKQLYSNWK